MAYDPKLADRIREYIIHLPDIQIEEKKMFGGLAFMVNGIYTSHLKFCDRMLVSRGLCLAGR